MKLTNKKIYEIANNLLKAFNDSNQKLPIKFNFIIQKNKKILLELAEEIEQSRKEILERYGTYIEESQTYQFTKENTDIANKELQDLLEIEQELNIVQFKLEDIEKANLDLTISQMDAIMFMIDEGEEE